MITNINTNKKFQGIIKDLFFKCSELNISFVFITQSYFSVPEKGHIKFYKGSNSESSL